MVPISHARRLWRALASRRIPFSHFLMSLCSNSESILNVRCSFLPSIVGFVCDLLGFIRSYHYWVSLKSRLLWIFHRFKFYDLWGFCIQMLISMWIGHMGCEKFVPFSESLIFNVFRFLFVDFFLQKLGLYLSYSY